MTFKYFFSEQGEWEEWECFVNMSNDNKTKSELIYNVQSVTWNPGSCHYVENILHSNLGSFYKNNHSMRVT